MSGKSDFIEILLDAGLKKGTASKINGEIKELTKDIKPVELEIKMDDKSLANINKAVNQIKQLDENAIRVTKNQQMYLDGVSGKLSSLKQEIADLKRTKDSLNDSKGNSGADKTQKETEKIKEQTEKLSDQIEVWKKRKQLALENVMAKSGDNVNKEHYDSIIKRMNELTIETPKARKEMQLLNIEISKLGQDARLQDASFTDKITGGIAGGIDGLSKNVMAIAGMYVGVNALFNELRKGISIVNEMDGSLTEIAMVTNRTRDEVSGLAMEYNKLAKDMKVSTNEVTQGAVTFFRQGLAQEEVLDRLEKTTMYSKVANMDFSESAEILTAVLNSMGIEAEKAVDVMLYLGDATATSGEEVGKGFAKTSGSARAMNLEFEKVSSWIATISATTRESAETIGTSINSILTRMTNLKETGYYEDDNTQINNVAKALSTIGIELIKTNGEWNDFGQIMDEIGGKWGDLDGRTKSYIATSMAGTQQASRFLNLMESYSDSVELYQGALESQGTASEKFDTYLDSNQAKIDELKATMEGFWLSVLDSDMLMSFVTSLTTIITKIQELVENHGELIAGIVKTTAVIGGLLVAGNTLYSGGKKIYEMGKFLTELNLASKVTGLIGATTGLSGATGGLTLATAGLNPVLLGIIGLTGAVAFGFKKWRDATEDQIETLNRLDENSLSLTGEVSSLDNLISKYDEISSREKMFAEDKQELLEVQRELALAYPELTTSIDDEGNAIATNIEMTRELLALKQEELELNDQEILQLAGEKLPALEEELDQYKNRASEIRTLLDENNGKIMETRTLNVDMGESIEYTTDVTQKYLDELKENIGHQQELIEESGKYEGALERHNQRLEEKAEKERWVTLETIAHKMALAETKEEVDSLTQQIYDLGFGSSDVADIMNGNIDNVKERWAGLDYNMYQSVYTMDSIDDATRQMYLNRMNLDADATQVVVDNAGARLNALKIELDMLSRLSGSHGVNIGGKGGEVNWLMGKAPTSTYKDVFGINSPMDDMIEQGQAEYRDAFKEYSKAQSDLKMIKDGIEQVKSLPSPKKMPSYADNKNKYNDRKNKNKKPKSAKKKKEEYKAEFDRYQGINVELEKYNSLISHNKSLQEFANDDMAKKFKLMENEKDLYKEKQKALNKLNTERRKESKELETYLSKQGFKFSGSGDDRMVTNLKNIEGKTKDVENALKRYVDLQSKEIPSASNDWWGLEQSISKVNDEMDKIYKDQVKQLIQMQKDFAYADYEYRKKQSDSRLDALESEYQETKDRNDDQIKEYEDRIQAIRDQEKAEKDRKEREDKIRELQDAKDRYYQLQNIDLENMSESTAKLLGLEKEREKSLKHQTDLKEKQLKLDQLKEQLENVKRNKKIKQLTKDGKGNLEWEYVADQKEIDKIQKEIEQTEQNIVESVDDYNKEVDKLKADAYDRYKKLQEDFDAWEKANRNNREIERLQSLIKSLQDETKSVKDNFDDIKKITNQAYKDEKENLDNFYRDIDQLTDDEMKVLKETFGDNWDEIANVLKTRFNGIESDYIALLKVLSQPIDVSGGGEYISTNTTNKVTGAGKEISNNSDWGWGIGKGNASGSNSKSNEEKLKSDSSFLESEKERTKTVIANREKAGMDISDQQKYLDRLNKGSYANGGKITKTGTFLVNMHGETNKPEWIFNDNQLKEVLSQTATLVNRVQNPVEKSVNRNEETNIILERIEFPNVESATEIKKALESLSTYAKQWSRK